MQRTTDQFPQGRRRRRAVEGPTVLAVALASVALCGFSYAPRVRVPPLAIRQATWDALDIELDACLKTHLVRLSSPTLQQMEGRSLSFEGYLLPRGQGTLFTRFLLVRGARCATCDSDEADAIEVVMTTPTPYDGREMTVTGRLHVRPNPASQVHFELDDAKAAVGGDKPGTSSGRKIDISVTAPGLEQSDQQSQVWRAPGRAGHA